ncbi:hypothetical protein NCCP133_09260 [Cytobacillus sp. NCCP-133]|nr:hypothetical protein NCCP133_09260 [Cytobacillus sp. NCCP-133]
MTVREIYNLNKFQYPKVPLRPFIFSKASQPALERVLVHFYALASNAKTGSPNPRKLLGRSLAAEFE